MSSNEIGVAKSDSARRRNDFETAPVYKYFEPGILCGSLVVRGRKVNNYSYKCKICMKLNRKKNGKDTFVCSAQGISSNLFHHLKSLGHGEALAELRRNHEKRRRRRPNAVNTGNLEQNNSGYFEGGDETAPGMMEESDPNMMSSMIPSGSHHVGINHNGEGDYEDGEEDEDNDDGDMGDDDDGMYYSGEFSHAQALALAEVDNDSAYHHHHHHHNDICSQQSELQSPTQTQIQHRHNEGYENVFDASASVTTNSKPPSTYLNSTGLGRGLVRRPSQPAANVITTPPVTTSDGSILVGAPNQDAALVQSFRTRRTKCLINFALEDFSRIHTHFSDRNRPGYIETPVYSFQENEKIKFQLRFVPSKHHMSAEVVYRGTDFSAQLLVDIYLVDINGKRFQFDYGRRVEASVNAINSEALNNVIYDRDDLEKRRDKLFSGDKLVIGIEVNATWVDSGDQLSGISE